MNRPTGLSRYEVLSANCLLSILAIPKTGAIIDHGTLVVAIGCAELNYLKRSARRQRVETIGWNALKVGLISATPSYGRRAK
jgi:hypothetical protein